MPNGITVMTDYNGRKTGEAYVQFVDKESTEKALQKHREKIGHRWVGFLTIGPSVGRSAGWVILGVCNFIPRPHFDYFFIYFVVLMPIYKALMRTEFL